MVRNHSITIITTESLLQSLQSVSFPVLPVQANIGGSEAPNYAKDDAADVDAFP